MRRALLSRRPASARLALAALLVAAPVALAGCAPGDDEPPVRSENGDEVDGETGPDDPGREPGGDQGGDDSTPDPDEG